MKLDQGLSFGLYEHQVPEPPRGRVTYGDALMWLIIVMDKDDSSLGFAVSCLSHYLKTGGLSQKQCAAVRNLYARVEEIYQNAELDCQKNRDPDEPSDEDGDFPETGVLH